ncbi:MAG: serine--tRNA ligase [Candidatus Harrisonbacteria bacterium CG10_big_fil_rev_8_21_14_0_10_45_28]|uniref:Serine--tRNA ligase n=1 Tax=Candidatus Harrisonbacteria bacterium CG10_big_fil_rev_8_21_14_0_10_45_28 TaxID=1974586 RepID=A0A2H0UNZ4_9BACT|nr:MAG: serine--tRNA ligase [Candidatus Harrisonbacteria bacterium CG10_big_fil_rev_8_21_14_0_10_45_28]
MIDIEDLRKNPSVYRTSMEKRNRDVGIINRFLEVDLLWRESLQSVEKMRAEQKHLSQERKIDEAKSLKEKIQAHSDATKDYELKRQELLLLIPNILLSDVPVGKDANENKVLRQWGTPKKFNFEVKDHIALGQALDIIDNERASKISGARFTYLKGGAASLQLALINLVFAALTNPKIIKKIAGSVNKNLDTKPFVPVFPPHIINEEPYRRAGRLRDDNKDDKFHIESDNRFLIGSAEHSLATMFMDETLNEADLPLRFIAYSPSYRREAGSYGKDTKGILRMHQFDKLEMESFTSAKTSEDEQNFFVAIQEYLMQKLDIPYQVVAICTGDMADPDARQIDIETWMPGQNCYRETHTSDLMLDYQTRGLNTKIKHADGLTSFAHTNDATAFAIGRILIAILENYQTAKGTVTVPKALQKYTGFKEIK